MFGNMYSKALLLAASLLVLACSSQAQGPVVSFTAKLGGSKVVPTPVDTRAYGSATVFWYNDTYATGEFRIVKIQDAFMAHIHAGNASSNGPVAVWAWRSLSPDPVTGAPTATTQPISTGATWIFLKYSFNPSTKTSSNVTVTELLLGGNTYFNIHTVQYPAGEIRGQFIKDRVLATPWTWPLK